MSSPPTVIPSDAGVPFADAVETIRQRVDIVDVVGRTVVLKRQGRNYVGLCPFHNDKHPSFSVNREKGLYKCFSCGEGGDAFGFVMKRESRNFAEVVEQFADELGIVIARGGKSPHQRQQEKDEQQQLLALNAAAAQWFVQQLHSPAGESVQQYLANRALTPETLRQFGIGLALPGWENLANYLRQHHQATDAQLVAAGLATQKASDSGSENSGARVYDRFRHRLMIPIRDERGRTVAFGGRTLATDDSGPKYLNSSESAIYHKSRVLYGLNQEALRTQRHALVMEGYFDVMAAHQAGFANSVAVCGTALTEDHVRLLRRFDVEQVTLCLDADEAGQRATLSALATLKPFPITVSVLVVPAGKDPADYIQQHGVEGFQQLLATHTQDALTYQCERAVAIHNVALPEGRANAVSALAPLLGQEANPVRFREYVTRWAQRLGIYTDDLLLACQPYRPTLHTRPLSPTAPRKKGSYGGQSGSVGGFNQISPQGAISSIHGALNTHTPTLSRLTNAQNPSAIALLESGWFALLFINKDSYNFMLSRLAGLRLDSSFGQWLQQHVLANALPTPQASLASLQQGLDAQLLSDDASVMDQPAFHAAFASLRLEIAKQAEIWAAGDPATFMRRFADHVARLEKQLAVAQHAQRLSPLTTQTSQREETLLHAATDQAADEDDLSLIELQYAFRDALTASDAAKKRALSGPLAPLSAELPALGNCADSPAF